MEYGVWRTEYSVHPTDMQYVGSVPVVCSASNGLDLRRKKKEKKKKKERTVKQPKKRNVRESLLPVEGSLVRR